MAHASLVGPVGTTEERKKYAIIMITLETSL